MTTSSVDPQQILQAVQQIDVPTSLVASSPLDAGSPWQLLQQLLWLLVHEPSQLALGWWLVLGVIALLLSGIALLCWRRFQRNAYRRYALKELQQVYQVSDDGEFIRAAARLLKRVCVAVDPSLAAMYGDPWQQALQQLYPKLDTNCLGQLTQAQYQPHSSLEPAQVLQQLKQFIQQHRRGPVTC